MTFENSRNAISSPASASGPTLFDWADGPTTDPSGPAPAPASPFPAPGSAAEQPTPDTSGRRGYASSASAALRKSLASRLQARTVSAGPTLYKLTWKERTTPAGLSIPALRATARRTSGKGSVSQPTIFDLPAVGWPTPTTDAKDWSAAAVDSWLAGVRGSHHMDPSCAAQLAGWPTPMAGTPAQNGNNEAGNTDSSRKTVALCGWPTPRTSDGNCETAEAAKKEFSRKHAGGGSKLAVDVHRINKLAPARLTASGEMLTGFSAEMEGGGQLNPAHSRWLQGLPPAWDACAPTATRSTRKRRVASSKPTSR